MEIVLDEVKKEGVLLKKDGTEVSRYSFKNLLKGGYTIEDLRKDNADFNTTLVQMEEFDNIKQLSEAIKIHNWD